MFLPAQTVKGNGNVPFQQAYAIRMKMEDAER
jgi:hypothetical protein